MIVAIAIKQSGGLMAPKVRHKPIQAYEKQYQMRLPLAT
jgi:hypothetical protein